MLVFVLWLQSNLNIVLEREQVFCDPFFYLEFVQKSAIQFWQAGTHLRDLGKMGREASIYVQSMDMREI